MKNVFTIALLAGSLMVHTAAAQTAPAKPRTAPAKPGSAASAQTRIPSYTDLKYPPLPAVQIPNPEVFTLSNGIKVYMLENHELPLISGFALVRTGNLFDPPDKVGLATITGMVMRTGGTKARTGDQIDEDLENLAASVESSIGETNGQVSFSGLSDNTDTILATFAQVLTEAEFRQEKLDLAKTQMKSAISRRNDDAGGIASREFAEILYGRDNPYGWRMEYATVDNIQRDDVVAFYKRYFFPANIVMAVYGDFSSAEMKNKLQKTLGGWNYQQPAVPPFPTLQAKAAPGSYLAAKDDVTQTFFRVGHLGGVLKDKDYPALEVMSDILGGGFSSRLFQRVRTQLGWAYNVGADWGANYNHPGLFTISGSTKSETTVDTLNVVREEIQKIRTAEVSEEELRTSKEKVVNSFVFNFDRPSKTLSRMVIYDYYGYPKDFIFQYQKGVEAVTKADVLRVAKQHLRPDALAVVAVGNPKQFGKPLTALGLPVQNIDLSIPQPKAQTAKADPASLAKGKALLGRVQQAVGGAEKLAAVRDSMMSAGVELQAGGGPLKARQRNQWMASGHFRQDLDLPFGKMSTYFDGASGWMASPQGTGALPPPVVTQVKSQMFRAIFPLLLSDRDSQRTVNAVGEDAIEISDKQGHSVKLQIDPTTGLPVKQVYQSVQQGGPTEVVETYSDWREVDGVKLPFKILVEQGGRKFADVTVEEAKLNSGLKPEDLSKKP